MEALKRSITGSILPLNRPPHSFLPLSISCLIRTNLRSIIFGRLLLTDRKKLRGFLKDVTSQNKKTKKVSHFITIAIYYALLFHSAVICVHLKYP